MVVINPDKNFYRSKPTLTGASCFFFLIITGFRCLNCQKGSSDQFVITWYKRMNGALPGSLLND